MIGVLVVVSVVLVSGGSLLAMAGAWQGWLVLWGGLMLLVNARERSRQK